MRLCPGQHRPGHESLTYRRLEQMNSDTAIRSILVVDDEEEYRRIIEQILLGLSYSCDSAGDASEALEKLGRKCFDLVVSDIMMTEKDGLELMREARENWPHLDFIIITGHAEYSYSKVIEAGAADFISKPIEAGELKAKIERIAREKRIYQQLQERNEELSKAHDRLQCTLKQAVGALASTVEIRDPYTAGHQRRVAHLACAMAHELGLSVEMISAIRMAGLVHDIGKISVPSEILSRPSLLPELEMSLTRNHVHFGYEILRRIDFQWPVAEIALQHHERMDGSGYPLGLSGDGILLEARILAVADVVEAMSSHRPYRAALGVEEALEELARNRGKLYDPEAVDACLRLFTEKGYELPQDPSPNKP
jgi:putative two-component system response regulator